MQDADVLIPEHLAVTKELLQLSPKLRLVQTGAGFNNVDLAECTRRKIWVCNAAGVNAEAVAEHTMAMILCWYKNISYLDRFMKNRVPDEELHYQGSVLSGKTVGIIGLGAVGRKVAKLCDAFGMRILGYAHKPVSIPNVELVSLEQLYAQSDIVTVHVPLNPTTCGMIGEGEFAKMKRTALLVNTARGPIVDEAQLIEALRNQRIAGACLDVYESEPLDRNSPLRTYPNVLLTPHTAGFPDGVKFHKERYQFFAANIQKVMAGLKPECALNDLE